ncbi:MAG: hypothetical protein Hens2KO_20280 [Henriciella sp.]
MQNDDKGDIVGCKIDQHLGRKIAEARGLAGMSVSQLAPQIGVAPDQLERMEKGIMRVDALSLARCAKTLQQPLKWFYAGLPGQSKFETSNR